MELPEAASQKVIESELTKGFNKQTIYRLLKEKISNLRFESTKKCNQLNA